jgi:hypothetical protein
VLQRGNVKLPADNADTTVAASTIAATPRCVILKIFIYGFNAMRFCIAKLANFLKTTPIIFHNSHASLQHFKSEKFCK